MWSQAKISNSFSHQITLASSRCSFKICGLFHNTWQAIIVRSAESTSMTRHLRGSPQCSYSFSRGPRMHDQRLDLREIVPWIQTTTDPLPLWQTAKGLLHSRRCWSSRESLANRKGLLWRSWKPQQQTLRTPVSSRGRVVHQTPQEHGTEIHHDGQGPLKEGNFDWNGQRSTQEHLSDWAIQAPHPINAFLHLLAGLTAYT